MNSQLHQYPAALYSAVQETGYRAERFTGEVLRSGRTTPRHERRPLLARLRHAFTRDRARQSGRPVRIYPMHEAR